MASQSRRSCSFKLGAAGPYLGSLLTMTLLILIPILMRLILTSFIVAIVAGVFPLVFVVVVIIGRTQVDRIQQDAGDLRIHPHENVARTAQRLLGRLSRAYNQHNGIGTRRQYDSIGD